MSFKNDHTPVWEPVTLSDTAAQNYYGLLVGAAGNVVFKSEAGGSDVTITGASAGLVIPGRITLVKSTGTTATVFGARAY
jgi:hypothetical protein